MTLSIRSVALSATTLLLLIVGSPQLAAQPFTRQIAPFGVERSDGSALLNPFSGGLAQPRITLRDADRDGLPDLFTLSPDNQLRLYRNEGSLRFRRIFPSPFDAAPVRSWFRFADIDADGDDDLYTAGARSEVLYLQNNGTQSTPLYKVPADTLRGSDGAGITMQQETVPSLVDIDGDGDLDLFSGNLDGSITFYENTGTRQAAAFTFRTSKFEGILVVSNGPEARRQAEGENVLSGGRHGASVLDFVDLDSDGDLDLLFGDFFTTRLLYFPNAGSAADPSFSMATLDTAFGPAGDLVLSEGFNQPTSGDIDGDGDVDVVVSSLLPFSTVAPILLYENRGTATAPQMKRNSLDLTAEIDLGSYTAPAALDDRDHHGLLVGTTSGALTYFQESSGQTGTVWRSAGRYPIPGFVQTAPATGDLDGDGLAEIVVGDSEGRLGLFRFDGNRLAAIPSELDTIKVNQNASPSLADLDADGDLDLMVGTGGGLFLYLENRGSASGPRFERTTAPEPFNTLDVGNDAAPRFADLDRDGDLDAIVGFRIQMPPTDLLRFLIRENGVFISSPSWPDIPTIRNPVPLYRTLPEGRFLLVGNILGGMSALRDERPSAVPVGSDLEDGVHLQSGATGVGVRWQGLGGENSLHLFDLLGHEVAEVALAGPAGRTEIDGAGLAPGVYFWRVGEWRGKIVLR
jgi:hypothetical protein